MISRLIQPNILLSAHYLDYNDDNNSIKSLNSSKTTQNKSSNTNESSMAQNYDGPFGLTSQLIYVF